MEENAQKLNFSPDVMTTELYRYRAMAYALIVSSKVAIRRHIYMNNKLASSPMRTIAVLAECRAITLYLSSPVGMG